MSPVRPEDLPPEPERLELSHAPQRYEIITTRTTAEHDIVIARQKSGEIQISMMEVGIRAPDPEPGHKRGKRCPFGWTFHVYHQPTK
jgi:hypothetical protein